MNSYINKNQSQSHLKRTQNTDIMNALESARIEYENMQRIAIISSYTFPTKPSKDGIYRIYVSDPSKKSGRKQLSSSTLEGLKDKVYAYERRSKESKLACQKTVRDVFLITQDEKLRFVKSEEKRYSVLNTINRAQVNYNRFFKDTDFENMTIASVTKNDLEDILYLNLTRYNLNKKSFAGLKGILKPIFELAFQEYWIDDNPYARINFKKFSSMLVEEAPIEKRYHSEEEIERMLSYIHDKQVSNKKLVTSYALEFQIMTGTRRGEIPPLRWCDISGYIYIHREMIELPDSVKDAKNRFPIVEHTKTNRNRKFPVTMEIQEFLDRLKVLHKENGWDSEFLFPADNENGCITANAVYKFYWNMCKTLGIEISHSFRKGPHSFRRTKVTEIINKTGGNVIMASQLFGHSPEVAKNHYYVGLDLDEARKILEA